MHNCRAAAAEGDVYLVIKPLKPVGKGVRLGLICVIKSAFAPSEVIFSVVLIGMCILVEHYVILRSAVAYSAVIHIRAGIQIIVIVLLDNALTAHAKCVMVCR